MFLAAVTFSVTTRFFFFSLYDRFVKSRHSEVVSNVNVCSCTFCPAYNDPAHQVAGNVCSVFLFVCYFLNDLVSSSVPGWVDLFFFLAVSVRLGLVGFFFNGSPGKLVDSENSTFLVPCRQEIAFFLLITICFTPSCVCDVCRFDLISKKNKQYTINVRREQTSASFQVLPLL